MNLSRLKNSKGQIVVEYVLLLTIAITMAMIIVSLLVKRDTDDPENSGALIRKWRQIQETIGNDTQN
ncbi:MAG: hypothetical protein COT73_08975 [Bdellovibrio sp. CG10_big_fil_rev_8_21_14_0_10_47_8]|nr:MAG: hypothetical protein COT73_08975 [Bdellovibrio sp. CG10_big_fil_rev_8_21_14_0_10_47_8]